MTRCDLPASLTLLEGKEGTRRAGRNAIGGRRPEPYCSWAFLWVIFAGARLLIAGP